MAHLAIPPPERQPGTHGSHRSSGPIWQTLGVDDALLPQSTHGAGGSRAAASAARLQKYGPNAFTQAKQVPGWLWFLQPYRDTMHRVRFAAGLVRGFVVPPGAPG